MIVMSCDRCKEATTELWRVGFHFVQVVIDEEVDPEQSPYFAEVCEACADALEQLFAMECGKPDPLKPRAGSRA